MTNSLARLSTIVVTLTLFAFSLTACADRTAAVASGDAMLPAASNRPRSVTSGLYVTPGHLLVLDSRHSQLLEFPIIGGVVSTKADIALKLSVPSGDMLSNLATDATGNEYVFSYGNEAQVAVYAPEASNAAAPLRILDLPTGPANITVDDSGNIYYANASIYGVYAAGASGAAAPIDGFSPIINTIYAMSVVGSSLYTTSVYEEFAYSNAIAAPAVAQVYCLAHQGKRFMGIGGSTVDPISGRFFVGEPALVKSEVAAIAVFPLDRTACPSRPPKIHVSPTPSGRPMWPGPMQFFDGYLAVVDPNSNAVYQIKAEGGVQAPIVTLRGSFTPARVAVGP